MDKCFTELIRIDLEEARTDAKESRPDDHDKINSEYYAYLNDIWAFEQRSAGWPKLQPVRSDDG